jgi:hypothetical protein
MPSLLAPASYFDNSLSDFRESLDFSDYLSQDEDEEERWNPYDLWPEDEYESMFFLVLGWRGAGKTLLLQILTLIMLARWSVWRGANSHCKVFSNYHDALADIQHPDLVLWMSEFSSFLRNGIAKIDEILQCVKSMNVVTSVTQAVIDWVGQMRKLDIDVVAATQRPRRVPDDILDQVNFLLYPERPKGTNFMTVRIWDLHGQHYKHAFGRKPRFPMPWEYDKRWIIWNVDKLYSTYNTHERIPSIRIKDPELRNKQLEAEGWEVKRED